MRERNSTPKHIIFSDLDGTLLDHDTYSFENAIPALSMIHGKNIPLVLCTSKTKDETIHIQNRISIKDPFIVENGGGIFIPKNYFTFDIHPSHSDDHYDIIDIGTPYAELTAFINEFRIETGYDIKEFSSMTAFDIADITGLDYESALLAQKRNYDEPFIIKDPNVEILKECTQRASAKGLTVTQGGRFHHITGANDKGKAVTLIIDLFRKEYGDIFTIALGDGINDIPMLRAVDKPVLIRSKHTAPDISDIPHCITTEQYGPDGWNTAVRALLMLHLTDD